MRWEDGTTHLYSFRVYFREEASKYLADYELCVQRVKVELKSDLGEKENNTRSA